MSVDLKAMFELKGLKQKNLAVKLRIPAVYGGENVKIEQFLLFSAAYIAICAVVLFIASKILP